MRRIDDMALPFFQVGIRSFSKEEFQLCQEKNWHPWTMSKIHLDSDWIKKLIADINGRPVYLTFDLDALDPSIMPATGTPEPDGFNWAEATQFIRYLSDNTTIVGVDFVELAPPVGPAYSGFTAAKLIYRTIGYICAKKRQD
jgi:agmatinase